MATNSWDVCHLSGTHFMNVLRRCVPHSQWHTRCWAMWAPTSPNILFWDDVCHMHSSTHVLPWDDMLQWVPGDACHSCVVCHLCVEWVRMHLNESHHRQVRWEMREQVSYRTDTFNEYRLFHRALLQKRPIIDVRASEISHRHMQRVP